MTQNVSDLMRILRQRSRSDVEAQDQQIAWSATESQADAGKFAESPTHPIPDLHDSSSASPSPINLSSMADNGPSQPLRSYRLAAIPVDQILIDPHQPRRTLPDDLRDACAQGRLNPREALFELCRRAQAGDALISLRVKQLRELADSIRDVGLEYPPKVTKVRAKNGAIQYRLVDGERRFWAWLLLLASVDEAERVYRESIPAMVEDDGASAEHILRSQWATNLHRERVPVVDVADYVLSVRDSYASRLQLNPQPWIASLGAEGVDMTVPIAILALTSREIAATMGKRMSRSTLFRYLAIAEKMRADAKAIARVRQFGLRQCEWLSRLSPAQQIEAARHLKPVDEESETESPEADGAERVRSSGAGRPRLLDGRITMLVRVAGELAREREINLRKADSVKLQELRQATTDAIGVLQGYVRLIDHNLSAGAPDERAKA